MKISNDSYLFFLETVYFGKPIVGIPFMFDQHMNTHLAEQKGYGISVPFETLSDQTLAIAVNQILRNAW